MTFHKRLHTQRTLLDPLPYHRGSLNLASLCPRTGGRGAATATPRPERCRSQCNYPAASAGTSVAALGVPSPVTGSQPTVAG